MDNRYSNISLYDFIINNPNKDLEKFIIHIQQNKLENNLIKYSKKILKKLKNNNAITIKNINELQTEKMQQNNKSDYTLDNELNSLEKQLFYDNNIFSNLLYIIYKNILKSFIKNHSRSILNYYQEYITEYIDIVILIIISILS